LPFKKRPLQVWNLLGQAIGQNHGDETLPDEGLIAKKIVCLSSALALEVVVLMYYSAELWA